MAGIKKEPGPSAERVAANMRRIRRAQNLTTAKLAERLKVIGHPIADTGITKAEAGARRVDVDDLVPLAYALGATPNTLLMPEIGYLASGETAWLTPAVSGSAEHLWQWAQGERPLPARVPDFAGWLGGGEHPELEFSLRSRPYLTAVRAPRPGPAPGVADPAMRELTAAVANALDAGATGAEVRRVVELAITLPVIMTRDEISAWLRDGKRPEEAQR